MSVETRDPDLEKYCALMEELKRRMKVVEHFLAAPESALYEATAIESASLQVRKILELIALGSLVANHEAYSKAYTDIENHWDARKILDFLGKINPDFYPRPIVETLLEGPIVADWNDVPDGFLTKKDFVKVYRKCGSIAHADNPFGSQIDYTYYRTQIPKWLGQIVTLLNSHTIRLVGNPNLYLIHMQESRDGEARGYVFAPYENENS